MLKNLNGNYGVILSADGNLIISKIIEFLQNELGYILRPVNGQYNSYWFSGKKVTNNGVSKRMEMLDGPKYYKLILSNRGIEIVCSGSCNAYHMKLRIQDDIKEAMESRGIKDKAPKKVMLKREIRGSLGRQS
jgi:hypothetical protein|tara:strand:- start:799 stop:1197 length:399 start_codon:yes stop_codon:yes gene_type:complete